MRIKQCLAKDWTVIDRALLGDQKREKCNRKCGKGNGIGAWEYVGSAEDGLAPAQALVLSARLVILSNG